MEFHLPVVLLLVGDEDGGEWSRAVGVHGAVGCLVHTEIFAAEVEGSLPGDVVADEVCCAR